MKKFAHVLALTTVISGTTVLGATTEAQAAPTSCYIRLIENGTGAASNCRRGDGFHRITITCTRPDRSVYFRDGRWMPPLPNDSAAVCNRRDWVSYHAIQKKN
ncbi:hypothetical protein NLX83_37200 [Allokutzneria sp. A3M-2-11 16]|uniref:hypothetical protein n=1 Tax=Allokutzneria sp. A3M-2-11 16 TaxID=2962043 RepID=UPI0020B675A9|nr:hypothetical protein [Allokutzneria sp. A3M-2-11 16]MCP3804918.1 hypothetical protein [Allokutzneria sp. A3M-2-11 16]